jgi:hypothetical protein
MLRKAGHDQEYLFDIVESSLGNRPTVAKGFANAAMAVVSGPGSLGWLGHFFARETVAPPQFPAR